MNPNLFIWTSDWHLVSDDSEHGLTNETRPTDALALATHIASLQPAGVIDTGDCKDHYGLDSADELDRYVEKVATVLLPGMKRLPGNHDEVLDQNELGSNDLSLYNAKFGGPPYHWTLDWDAPKVRFMAIHSYMHHSLDGYAGAAHVDSSEVQWLSDQLATLPTDWQAIVCSHFPANPTFGAYIHFIDNVWTYASPHPLITLLAANSSRVCAYLSGHRHFNMAAAALNGIMHFSGPGVSYTIGNGYGGWVPITYDPALRTLIFDFRLGPPSSYDRKAGFTPVVIQLPPLAETPTCATYTFSSDAVLDGVGPLAGSPVSLSGEIEVAA